MRQNAGKAVERGSGETRRYIATLEFLVGGRGDSNAGRTGWVRVVITEAYDAR